MKMKIMILAFSNIGSEDVSDVLKSIGHEVITASFSIDYMNNQPDKLAVDLKAAFSNNSFDVIFSFTFFAVVSEVAQIYSIPYISWTYDVPDYALFSNSVFNSCSYIFSFDYVQHQMLMQRNVLHAYYLPLGIHSRRLKEQLGNTPWKIKSIYSVSFIGSFYDKNPYYQVKDLPEEAQGYIEALIDSQHLIYGENFIAELITDELVSQLNTYIPISNGDFIPHKYVFANVFNMELTKRERIRFLNQIASRFPLTLFTRADKTLVPGATYSGYVHYISEMPYVFCTSKINLNITIRSITSGIPLRALDVLGAGGFLLSNYQPELAQYFTDGEELVLFGSEEELMEKTDFYLKHDAARIQIAERGFKKVHAEFSYQKQLAKIFDIVGLPL